MTRRLRFGWLCGVLSVLAVGCSDEAPSEKNLENVTLPDPGPDGWQITTGTFEVAQGKEVQNCYFFEVPGDKPFFVKRMTVAQNEGSHHMNVFRVKTIQNLDGAPGEVVEDGECWKSPNWADWPLIMNTQQGGLTDFELPDGVVERFEPGEKIMIQTHFVNATTQQTPLGGKVVMNFERAPEGGTYDELGTIFATNQSIRVCPGDNKKKYEATCRFGLDHEVTIIGANGHFHSRGDRFTISPFDQFDGAGDPFYVSNTWDDPPMERDLNVKIPAGGGISYSCEFSAPPDDCGDPNEDCCYTFGGFVEFQEHCNAFAYFYPRGDTDVNCF
ncbi:MAG: hypothetical protein H6718_29485 [Polyangiaceae bacterium]|nr:hypothetical protein [Myxococcales bacterium]MCB9589583.1 hypothetical protein [Polyangiaceae bacterium]MCB9609211.1 hypothetical protein [Polyangiaceae bacterium]